MAERGYETSDATIRPLVLFLGGLAVLCAAMFGLMLLLFNLLEVSAEHSDTPKSPLAEERPLPPEPRLQKTTAADIVEVRAQAEAHLASYGWVDRTAGIAHMPIDAAVKLTLDRGLPVRGDEPEPSDGPAIDEPSTRPGKPTE